MKPSDCLTSEFYYHCKNSGNRLAVAIVKYAKTSQQTNAGKQTYFSFYINNNVDFHSLLKTIVLLANPEKIQYEKNPFFNPTDVSVESILGSNETLSYTYSLESTKYFNNKFYLKITPQESAFTKISIAADPFQILLMLKTIYYLGGYCKQDFKKTSKRSSHFENFTHFKFSQQGKWKANFTKNKIDSFLVPQKEQFFKDIKPISMIDVKNLYHDNTDFRTVKPNDQSLEFFKQLADDELKQQTIKNKEDLEKRLNQKRFSKNESDIIESHNFKA